MDKHITILGVLYLAFSVMGFFAAMVVFVAVTGGGLLSGESEAIVITTTVGSAVATFLIAISLPGFIGGLGLLKRFSWARILVLVLGALNLINIPFGTALGIYTFWVLLDDQTVRMFSSQG